MNMQVRLSIACGSAVAIVILAARAAHASVATARLGTGLADSGNGLPEVWVAPVTTAPEIDGQLDDDVWSAARSIVLGRLDRVRPAEPRTEVSLIHHDGVLYVGVKLDEPAMGRLRRNVVQTDGPVYQVRWVAPPLCNLPSRYFNWTVGISQPMPKAAPLELNLHYDRGSYWRTQYRLERDSIVISPHDFPLPTWWYGYHQSHGTLRSFSQGAIHNYTQRRSVSFVEWASARWPVDRGRVIVTGIRYQGGFGALRLGVSFPDIFAVVVTGHGLPDARYGVGQVNQARWSRGRFDSLVAAIGKVEWGLTTADGVNVWDALDVNRQIDILPPSAEVPLIAMTSSGDWTPCHEFYQLMLAKRRAVMGSYMWGGTTLLPVSATSTWPNAVRQLVRSDRPLLAFKSATVDELLAGGKQGEFNCNYRWLPETVVDKPDRCEVVVFYQKKYGQNETQTADVTIRRLAGFKPPPGATVSWSVTPVGEGTALRNGKLTIGADGLLVVPGVEINEAGIRIVVTAP